MKLAPEVHEGSVHIMAQPGAEIFLDGAHVGVGRWDGKVKSGGHTLRISAEGMLPYQTEMVINDDESRVIDTPPLVRAPEPKLWNAGGELAASLGVGEKMRAGGAAFFDLRFEIGVKPRWPTSFAFTVDVGSVVPGSNNCATDYHGATATSATDLSVRYAFQNCLYVKPGLLFALHFTPRSRFDVYSSIEGGARFGLASSTSYDPLGSPPTAATTEFIAGVDVGGRIGVDFHPFRHEAPGVARPSAASQWSVGVFASLLVTIISKEGPDNDCCSSSTPNQSNDHGIGTPFPWLSFGARTSLTF